MLKFFIPILIFASIIKIIILIREKLNPYYAITLNILKWYFGFSRSPVINKNSELPLEKALELSGIFSQRMYIKKGQLSVKDISQFANDAVNNNKDKEWIYSYTLLDFIQTFQKKIMMIEYNHETRMTMYEKILKEREVEKEVVKNELKTKKLIGKALNNSSFKEVIMVDNIIEKYPEILNGNYDKFIFS